MADCLLVKNESSPNWRETRIEPFKMVVLKRDTTFNELFIKPIRGLYSDQVISVEDFKDRHKDIVRSRWVDTTHEKNGLKVYGLFDSTIDSEIVKENLQEWLCDNHHEVTECISIALHNHERTYSEWFRYVDSNPGPDELALYCLARKHRVQVAVFNKSYVWTTLAWHIDRTDEEILQLCGVNLVFTGPCEYGILRDIRRPSQNILVHTIQKTTSKPKTLNVTKKTTCRGDRSANKKKGQSASRDSKQTKPAKRARTLSESRSTNYGITPPTTTSTWTIRSGLQPIDYLSLNNGFENVAETSPKKRKRITHRPRSAPSTLRVAAQRHTTLPEAKNANKRPPTTSSSALTAIPSTSKASSAPTLDLSGVPAAQTVDTLPDLVQNRETSHLELPSAAAVDPVSTGEELDAIDALLSLSEVRNNTLGDDDNADLMPVGLPTNIVDAAPVPVRLDQLNVDTAIAEIVQTEELEKQATDEPNPDKNANKPDTTERNAAEGSVTDKPTSTSTDDRPKSTSPTQGSLKIKTHALKKKPESNRKYKCSVCGISKKSMQAVNKHHLKKHKLQICPICSHTFALASSLIRHSYDHEEKRYQYDACEYSCHFESELNAHKILHWKTPTFKCMYKGCGKWFMRKWELTVHDGKEFKCETCEFTTNLEKNLKEHQQKHSDDWAYLCKICNKGFHYRSSLKRHRDKEHKDWSWNLVNK